MNCEVPYAYTREVSCSPLLASLSGLASDATQKDVLAALGNLGQESTLEQLHVDAQSINDNMATSALQQQLVASVTPLAKETTLKELLDATQKDVLAALGDLGQESTLEQLHVDAQSINDNMATSALQQQLVAGVTPLAKESTLQELLNSMGDLGDVSTETTLKQLLNNLASPAQENTLTQVLSELGSVDGKVSTSALQQTLNNMVATLATELTLSRINSSVGDLVSRGLATETTLQGIRTVMATSALQQDLLTRVSALAKETTASSILGVVNMLNTKDFATEAALRQILASLSTINSPMTYSPYTSFVPTAQLKTGRVANFTGSGVPFSLETTNFNNLGYVYQGGSVDVMFELTFKPMSMDVSTLSTVPSLCWYIKNTVVGGATNPTLWLCGVIRITPQLPALVTTNRYYTPGIRNPLITSGEIHVADLRV